MARLRTGLVRSSHLKASALVFFAVWLAVSGVVFFHEAPVTAPLSDIYPSAPEAPLAAGNAGRISTSPGFDGLMADFIATNEISLVALHGYLLTGSDGFKVEWVKAMRSLDAAQTAIEVDSRNWTDGQKLVALRDMRSHMAALRNEQKMLADVIGTANRYPGLRLYREDTDALLLSCLTLLDETLHSVLASNGTGAAERIDTLAHIRGDITAMRLSLSAYLPSSAGVPPAELQGQYAAFRSAPSALKALRGEVSPEDQARIETLVGLLGNADAQLSRILALKQTPRWDYANYAFKQKVMPLADRISAIIAVWRIEG